MYVTPKITALQMVPINIGPILERMQLVRPSLDACHNTYVRSTDIVGIMVKERVYSSGDIKTWGVLTIYICTSEMAIYKWSPATRVIVWRGGSKPAPADTEGFLIFDLLLMGLELAEKSWLQVQATFKQAGET